MAPVLSFVLHWFLLAVSVAEQSVFIMLPPNVIVGEENTIAVRTTSEATKITLHTIISQLPNEIVNEESHNVKQIAGDQYGVDISYQSNFVLMTSSSQDVTFNITVDFCSDITCSVVAQKYATAVVNFVRRPIIILGETDKPLYRPGDSVRFRFLAVTTHLGSPNVNQAKLPNKKLIRVDDSNLRLVDLTTDDEEKLYNFRFDEIAVMDSTGNRVKMWRDVSPLTATGLNYSLLVDSPEGEWTITATTMDTTGDVHFQVRHYVLPRFVMAIKPPSNLVFDSAYAQFSVCSNYTNGPPIRGFVQAQLCVCSKPWDKSAEEKTKEAIVDENKCPPVVYSSASRPCVIAQKVVDSAGCALFNVSTKPLGLKNTEYSQWDQVAIVCAKVEEMDTKSTVADCDIGMHLAQQGYEHELKLQSVYKTGLPIYGVLTAPGLRNSQVKLLVSEQSYGCGRSLIYSRWSAQPSYLYSSILYINESGVAAFLIPPVNSTNSLAVKVIQTDVDHDGETAVQKVPPSYVVIRRPDDDAIALQVLRRWQDMQSAVMQLWPTEDSVQYVCPGVVSFEVIANTPLADKTFHVQSNVRGKILSHIIPAASNHSEPCVDHDGELGHYQCVESTGNAIACLQGWTGDNCLTPICDAKCHPRGGTCDSPNGCICVEGWKGPYCDECVRLKGCEHGTCLVGNDCVCEPGWSGYMCNMKEVEYEKLPVDRADNIETHPENTAQATDAASPKSRTFGRPVRTLFTRKLQFPITGEWGPDAMVVVYFYQENESGRVIVPVVVKLENMYQCISPSTAELAKTGKSGVQFDVPRAAPGQEVQLAITPTSIGHLPYNTTDESLGLCFVRLSDQSLSTFGQSENTVDQASVAKHLRQLTTYGSQMSTVPVNLIDAFRTAGLVITSSAVLDIIEPSIQMCLYGTRTGMPIALNFRGAVSEDGMKGASPSQSTQPKPRMRDFFPEVWDFSTYKLTSQSFIKELTVPDTITTWIASVFCTTLANGLWIPPVEKLTVTMPFYIDVTIPLYVKRGEILYLPISVFVELDTEHSKECLEVQVRTTIDTNDWIRVGTSMYTGCVCKGDKATFQLGLMPLRIGQLNVTVEAQATLDSSFCDKESEIIIVGGEKRQNVRVLSDMIQRQIRVIPEGVPKELVIGAILHIEPNETLTKQVFPINLPTEIVADSLRIYVSYTDEILGPVIGNLDSLIRLPSGCGEQNMVLVAPSVYVLDYLLSVPPVNTNRTAALIKQAKSYITMGYQRQLKYRLSDGSYSAFGEADKNGSTWLTAFVLQVFAKAYKVDSTLLVDWAMLFNETLAFLKHRQDVTGSGCFVELGRVIHSGMQGGTGEQFHMDSEVLLTAYVLIAIAQTKPPDADAYSTELTPMVDAGLRCLREKGLNGVAQDEWLQDAPTYGLAQMALALALFEPQGDLAVSISDNLVNRRLSNAAGSGFYWTNKGEKLTDKAGSLDIETTSYAYLALKEMGFQFSDLFLVIRWLSSQQSSSGGFQSTQDTILALEAISDGAKRVGLRHATGESADLSVVASIHPANCSVSSRLTPDNMRVVNRFPVPKVTRSEAQYSEWVVSSNGTSDGAYLSVQTIVYYNVPDDKVLKDETFVLTTSVLQRSFPQAGTCTSAVITVCLRLPDVNSSQQASGMLLVEIGMVSGWSPVKEELLSLIKDDVDSVRSVEVGSDGTVSLLFNAFSPTELGAPGSDEWSVPRRCAKILLKQVVYVQSPQSAKVVARDYYTPDRSSSTNYSLSDCRSAWFNPADIETSETTSHPFSTLSPEARSTSLPPACPTCELTAEMQDSLAEKLYRGLCTSYTNAFLLRVLSGSEDEYNATVTSFASSSTVASWNATVKLSGCSCAVVSTGNNLVLFSLQSLNIYPGDPELSIRSTEPYVVVLSVKEILPHVKSALDLLQTNTTVEETTDSMSPKSHTRRDCRQIQTIYRYIQAKML